MNWLREKTILRIKNLSCFFVYFVVKYSSLRGGREGVSCFRG